MAAMVQTLPPQTTVTVLPGRPSSSGGYPPSAPPPTRTPQQTRYSNFSSAGYRGVPSTGPVAPYAFTSTPQLAKFSGNPRPLSTNFSGKPLSAPMVPQLQETGPSLSSAIGQKYLSSSSMPSSPATASPRADVSSRPVSTVGLPTSSTSLSGSSAANARPPPPDRYRRNVRRGDSSGDGGPNRLPAGSAMPSGSGMAAVGQLYNLPSQSSSSPSLSSSSHQSYRGSPHNGDNAPSGPGSADDMYIGRSTQPELAARYRRRSFGSIETAGLNHSSDAQDASSPHPNTFLPHQPSQTVNIPPSRPSSHAHNGSSESVASSRSAKSSRAGSARNEPAVVSAVAPPSHPSLAPRQDLRPGNIPTRLGDSTRRHPSPLSQPVTLSADDDHSDAASSSASLPSKKNNQVVSPPPSTPSPAVEQLAAVSQKDAKKSKSKLRRAFSFGSAAELRKVTAQHNLEKSAAQAVPSKRNSKYEGELEPEQARIAEEQEAAGLGESIYSGQGHFFTGSTDNLSISSTASSASVMLRKMGKGVKKGTRSLVGLFRPKSIVGAAAAGGSASPASTAQVSMVTVEAEREKVHISVDPHDQAGGGTGLPKLDRNSIETNKASIDSGTVSSDGHSRRSIVGGEKERAEVLAAVKKGILKKTDSNQASPKLNAIDLKMPDFNLPQIPHIIDSPRSSAPSTPADETPRSSGHRRMDSITIETNDHDDYFMPMTRLTSIDSKTGAPQTPQGLMRNISFSPRIQFFDTWPSAEYDRRGDIATCNRLTPMLAQQIKEELNTFKMEMEVHESSKVYTHFF